MAINARGYVYRSVRMGGKVRCTYLGKGEMALEMEHQAALDREMDRRQRAAERREREELGTMVADLTRGDLLAREIAATALRLAGYHQHKRTWRRKRSVTASTQTSALPTREPAPSSAAAAASKTPPAVKVPPVPVKRLDVDGIIERASKGDRTAVPALREVLADPHNLALACRKLGNPSLARQAIAGRLFSKDLAQRELLLASVARMEEDLAGPRPTAIERALARKAADNWLALHFLEMLAVVSDPYRDRHLLRHQDSAQRRYLASLRTLALVRKLAVPNLALQVNVGAQQVNIQQGGQT